MGTSGSGNFDSDGAHIVLGDRSKELTDRVWAALNSTESTAADESEHDALFVDLEWILALEDAGCFKGWFLPPTAEFDDVSDIWLAAWSDYFDGLAGPDFKAERRAVIEETFDRFRAVCAKYEEIRT